MPDNAPVENPETMFTDASAAQELPQQPESSPPPPVEQLSAPTPPQQPAPPPQAPEPQSPDIMGLMRSSGYDTSRYSSPEEAVNNLLLQVRMQNQLLSQYQQPQQPEPEPEEQDEWNLESHFEKAWNLPKYDQSWDSMISSGALTKDASGAWVPTAGHEWLAMSPQLSALNQFEMSRSSVINDLFYKGNPYQNIWQQFQEPMTRMLNEKVEQMLEARFGEQRTMDQVAAFEKENSEWLYDKLGQPTEHGRKFYETVEFLQNSGMNDPAAILKVASQLVPKPQQSQPAASPATAPAPPPQAVSPQQSFLEQSLRAAAHHPSSAGGVAPPGFDPGQVSELDLDNLFVTAHGGQAAA